MQRETSKSPSQQSVCSIDWHAALRDIRELLKRGILVKNPSGGRSTSYRLADPDEVPVQV